MHESRAFTAEFDGFAYNLVTKVTLSHHDDLARVFKNKSQSKIVSAIWDTGATRSAISRRVAVNLNLKPLKYIKVTDANTTRDTPIYNVKVLLPHKIGINLPVSGLSLPFGEDMLIGMDIIGLGDLAITNVNGITHLSYRYPPRGKIIDFVKDTNKWNIKQKYKKPPTKFR